ncbi:MAG TPA: flagellar hook-basal body complex protein [Chthonomonadaceae bacterium]|nr:flagellar hook-basal body complex protein [Chthonomonadaceae bacterium]
MFQAMFSGVSGLQAHQTALDVIGNNIANVDTIGFKAGRVTFQDQLSQTLRASSAPTADAGGQNPSQVGLGVALGAVDTLQTQGNLQTTGKSTDMAIQGNGFFIVSEGSSVVYTRDGSFDLDSDGVLVNPSNGLKLLGYVADSNGNIDLSQQITNSSVLKVPVGSLQSVKQTSMSAFQGNLDASSGLQTTVMALTGELDTSVAPPAMNTTIYDPNGNAHTLQIVLANPVHAPAPGASVPVGATQRWDVQMTLDGVVQPTQKLYGVPNGAGGNNFYFATPAGGNNGSALLLNVPKSSTTPNFAFKVDFSGLQAKSNITSTADGQSTPVPTQSSLVTLNGNLNLDGAAPVSNQALVYDAAGNPFSVTTTFSAPTTPVAGPNVPTGATQQWDVKVVIDTVPPTGPHTVYDSSVPANNESNAYFVPGTGFVLADGGTPGNPLGSIIQLSGGALPAGNFNQGLDTATGFPFSIDLSKLTTTNVASNGDGQGGSPAVWNTSLAVFDSLGVKHALNFQFSRSLVGPGAPNGAISQWNWSATENGNPVADSTTAGNSPLFFDSSGKLLDTQKQKFVLQPKVGAAAVPVTVDFSALEQLSGASSVVATTQDGFPVGTLQDFTISPGGPITGTFSNGQTRTLGQVATASFSNPSGLEKQGDNVYSESANSGLAEIGLPNLSGRGKISTGFVEMSNVDLSTEFTNLITTQRGFQANTKIISTVDQLLQDIINLKQ